MKKGKELIRWLRKNKRSTRERLELKRRLVDELGGKCIDCGYSAHLAALDFDHVDPTQKKFEIARLIATKKDYLKIREEILKCVIRCANCHRIKTFPQATI